MRDQLISFSERRGSSLATNEKDFPPLLTADFEWSTDFDVLPDSPYVPNHLHSRFLNDLCMAKVKLCILIGRVLCTQYELKVHRRLTSTEPTMLFLPKRSEMAAVEYSNRVQELHEWVAGLFSASNVACGQVRQEQETVHCAMLEMLYWTIVGLVHRAHLAAGTNTDATREDSKQSLREAAERTTAMAASLQEQNLLRFQPPIVVTALFGSAMQHLRDAVSGTTTARSVAEQHLHESLASLNQLQEIWFSADNVVNFLATIRSKRSAPESTDSAQHPRIALQNNISVQYSALPQHRTSGLTAENHVGQLMLAEADIAPITPGSGNHCLNPADPTDGNSVDLNFDLVGTGDTDLSDYFDFVEFDCINWTNILQI